MFRFKQFAIDDSRCGMKLGTDSVALGAWVGLPSATDPAGRRHALDLGAGCGILALMAAQRSGTLIIDAVELDPAACDDCRANFAASPWHDRLRAHCCSFGDFEPVVKPDLIISNPPYFVTGLRAPQTSRAAARHELAMTVEAIVSYAARWLASQGSLALILPAERADQCIFQGELAGLKLRRQCDLSHSPGRQPIRTMLQLSRLDGPIERTTLAVRSDAFAALTAAFYL